ncbi:MAG: LysM peptidoglycan-binding domain-containing protein [Anaerolineae bacterium]
MNRNHSKIVFIATLLTVLLVLSGCGLNRRSASGTDPVVVEPIDVTVSDPTVDQTDDGATSSEGDNNGGEGSTDDGGAVDNGSGDNSGETGGDNSGESTDTTQPADGGGEGATTDPTAEPEAPRDDATDETPAVVEPTTEVPAAENPTPVPATAVPATGTAGTHPVQAGETLFTIALRYGLTVAELAAANGITNVNVLSAGQELIIPVAGTVEIPQTAAVHIVSYGDTFYSIALRYGLTVEELAQHNDIANINQLDVGQEIKIPTNDGK